MDEKTFMTSLKRQQDVHKKVAAKASLKLNRRQRYNIPNVFKVSDDEELESSTDFSDCGLFDEEFYDEMYRNDQERLARESANVSQTNVTVEENKKSDYVSHINPSKSDLNYIDSCYFDSVVDIDTAQKQPAKLECDNTSPETKVDVGELGYFDMGLLQLGERNSTDAKPSAHFTPGTLSKLKESDELNYMDQLILGHIHEQSTAESPRNVSTDSADVSHRAMTEPKELCEADNSDNDWPPSTADQLRSVNLAEQEMFGTSIRHTSQHIVPSFGSKPVDTVKTGVKLKESLNSILAKQFDSLDKPSDGENHQTMSNFISDSSLSRDPNLPHTVEQFGNCSSSRNSKTVSDKHPDARVTVNAVKQPRKDSEPSRQLKDSSLAERYQNQEHPSENENNARRSSERQQKTAEEDHEADSAGKSPVSRIGRQKLKFLVPNLDREPSYAVVDLLCENVIYEDGGTGVHHCLHKYLGEIATRLKCQGQLFICHRLDQDTTGTVLLAKSSEFATEVKSMFERRAVEKSYMAITRGVPKPYSGSITIPLQVDNKSLGHYRTVLVPPDVKSTMRNVFSAQTDYAVLKKSSVAALVELFPVTGRKHQLRAHLALAMDTPVLGDHKYSHQDKLAPQKLPGEILQRFQLTQSKARHMPMHLHAQKLVLPNYFSDGKALKLQAKLPKFFSRTIKLLKLKGL